MFGASELVKRPLSDIRDAGNEEHGSHSIVYRLQVIGKEGSELQVITL